MKYLLLMVWGISEIVTSLYLYNGVLSRHLIPSENMGTEKGIVANAAKGTWRRMEFGDIKCRHLKKHRGLLSAIRTVRDVMSRGLRDDALSLYSPFSVHWPALAELERRSRNLRMPLYFRYKVQITLVGFHRYYYTNVALLVSNSY
ncbi:hypothetical protein F4604DRAFT_57364 [Suillus subluteus]|nr:hypothetical protein F4604DRAFT_57364 [Suillus subluteus]